MVIYIKEVKLKDNMILYISHQW